jgi:hypothetical protein
MTDRDPAPSAHERADADAQPGADQLAAAVADLGETREDQLATLDERNASLEERLPDDAGSPPAPDSPEEG